MNQTIEYLSLDSGISGDFISAFYVFLIFCNEHELCKCKNKGEMVYIF